MVRSLCHLLYVGKSCFSHELDRSDKCVAAQTLAITVTVNPEIFVRVLFLRNFTVAKFCISKSLTKWRNHSVIK